MNKNKIFSSVMLGGFMVLLLFAISGKANAWWEPKRFENITWHWQLSGDLDTTRDVDMYDIDLFETSKSTIQALKNDGKIVICYFSAGSLEFTDNDREIPARADSPPFPKPYADITGNVVENYNKELWLDIRAGNVLENKIKPTIQGRLDLALEKGCDGVEVDNVNEYEVDDDDPTELPVQNEDFSPGTTGFDPIVTVNDQLLYNKWLASEAHARGLSIGLKNNIYQASDLVYDFDWALNEMCYQYTSDEDEYYECDYYDSFDNANKAVFGVEFNLEKGEFCEKANEKGRYWAKKNLILDEFQDNCNENKNYIITEDVSVYFGLTPIYRLYNKSNGVHLYTRGKYDGNKILSKWSDFEFTDGEPAFYASLTDDGTTPIYRLYNTRTGVHLYTRGVEDRDKILSKWSDFEFTDGEPAFYASLY